MLQIVEESTCDSQWTAPTADTSIIESEKYLAWMKFFNKATSTRPLIPSSFVEKVAGALVAPGKRGYTMHY